METTAALVPLTVDMLMQQSGVQFGTSGARGEVVAMTDRVCYGYTQGFLSYLREIGEYAGGRVALAGDLRPSTPRILAACAQAIRGLGGEPVFCGYVPTPALALYAFGQAIPCLMVTGSHIPDDRNGIKFYRPAGEVLKSDEAGMKRQVVTLGDGAFDDAGMLVSPAPLPAITDAVAAYVARYVDAFGADALAGRKIGVYQHSAVGRDVVLSIVNALGAEGVPIGRATKFIPVDTEAIRPEDVVLAREWAAEYGFDAIISTDGDSDRPLLADHTGEWLRGDVLGVLCARALGAGTVVTPVSSNTVLELSGAFAHCARTRIGSPFVIDAMNAALAAGQDRVCGYEANGGFLLASDFDLGGRSISALPTRDAVLPVVAVIAAARGRRVADLLGELPPRVTYSDRIQNFATERSEAIFAALLEGGAQEQIARLTSYFGGIAGAITRVDLTDGIRMSCADGSVLHLRRSGNAPELRCYSEADDVAKATAINAAALKVVLEELA
ncbi:phosphomannomutase [Novosphingobium sp. 1748]|uniref:phosphomannomutase n=1 Tax=Novosphingobium sp. 1748 TaxID=2817760 RepID=UPI00285C385A|nr:phosphomannomutase [Novosphingobium sp. 1748]MDR6706664.1 phosphomannomutase [Novosphingobium sp. 1748]